MRYFSSLHFPIILGFASSILCWTGHNSYDLIIQLFLHIVPATAIIPLIFYNSISRFNLSLSNYYFRKAGYLFGFSIGPFVTDAPIQGVAFLKFALIAAILSLIPLIIADCRKHMLWPS